MNEDQLKFAQQYAEIAKLYIDMSVTLLLKDIEIARLKKAHQEIASGERQRKTTNEFDEKMKKAYKAIVDSALDDTDAQMKKRA
jgi:hypothetical protein